MSDKEDPNRHGPLPKPADRAGGHGGTPLLIGIQLLRGVAAMMVVLSHTNTMMGHGEFFGAIPFGFRHTGSFGVGIFFAISGFIIAYITLDEAGRPRIGVKDYAMRRFIRIMPFVWVCTLGYNLLSLAGTGEIEWGPMLRAMAIWPTGELKPNVLWSLRHEWLFYVLFAISLMGPQRLPVLLGAWFIAPVVYGALLIAVPDLQPADTALRDLLRVVLLGSDCGANLQFAAGFGIALLHIRRSRLTAPSPRISLLSVVVLIAVATVIVERLALPVGLARTLLWTALAALILWAGLVAGRSSRWFAATGRVLGDASFSIYLVHNPALLILFHLAAPLRDSSVLPILYVVFVIGATVAGIIVHYLIESRLIAHVSRLWRQRRASARARTA